MMTPLEFLTIYVLVVNLLGFLLMGRDKSLARAGGWRVPEKNFLLLALIGGSAGVIFGVRAFRHKTRHAKFTVAVPAILAVQLLVLGWSICPSFR